MEGENVRVVKDGPHDEPELWNPARRWRLAAVAAIGLVVVLVLVLALGSTDEPLTTQLEALPAPTTTELTTTTTAMRPTTTTIAGQTIRDAGTYIQPSVERYCQRAIAATPTGLLTPEEWFDVNYPVFNTNGNLGYIYTESSEARNAQDEPLVDALALAIADLEDAQEALDKAFDAIFREGTDDWAHQFTLVVRLCERLTRNVEAMVSYGIR